MLNCTVCLRCKCWLTELQWKEVFGSLFPCCTFDISPWDKWTAQLEGQSKSCAILSGHQAWDAGKQRADRADSCIAPHPPFFPLQTPGGVVMVSSLKHPAMKSTMLKRLFSFKHNTMDWEDLLNSIFFPQTNLNIYLQPLIMRKKIQQTGPRNKSM